MSFGLSESSVQENISWSISSPISFAASPVDEHRFHRPIRHHSLLAWLPGCKDTSARKNHSLMPWASLKKSQLMGPLKWETHALKWFKHIYIYIYINYYKLYKPFQVVFWWTNPNIPNFPSQWNQTEATDLTVSLVVSGWFSWNQKLG